MKTTYAIICQDFIGDTSPVLYNYTGFGNNKNLDDYKSNNKKHITKVFNRIKKEFPKTKYTLVTIVVISE